jgi:2-polyprenyl-6-methoxyphenol hydroxylase-like FAD-dependent oxidoreductase
VVIGASLAGSLAAATVAAAGHDVVLIERDQVPTTAQPRPGIPHGRFPHLLLPAGVRGLEALLPGIIEELVDAGALLVSIPQDVRILTPFGWFPSFPSDLHALACSRSLLDHQVRTRVLRDHHITVQDRTTVTGLGITAGRMRDIRVQQRGTGTATTLPATLVVDASGRRSHTPEWLAQAGYRGHASQRIDAGVSYAVRTYPPPTERRTPRQVLNLQAAPPADLVFGILIPTEDGIRQAGIGAMPPHTAPRTADEFTRATSLLRHSALAEALDVAPTGPVRTFHPGASRWHRYDRWHRWPNGLIVLGDALCTFNPIYGQGMSVAISQVLALRRALSATTFSTGGHRSLRRDLARTVRPAWTLSSTEDWRFPHTSGQFRPFSKLIHRALDHLLSIAMTDQVLAHHLAEIFALTRPPTSLASRDVLRAVATGRACSAG